MKLVNILLSNKKGGVEDAFITHCKILQNISQKHQGEILAIVKYGAPYAINLKKTGIKVIEIKNYFGYYDFLLQKKIQKITKTFKADLICAHVGKGISIAKKIGKNLNIPSIAVNHSNNVKRSIGCNIILAVNKEISKKIVDLGQNPKTVWTIPNVIEFNEKDIREIPYQKFDINSKITIGAMGRMSPEKEFDILISAIKICRENGLKTTLNIAGNGKEKQNLTSLAKKLNINNEIKLFGWVDDKRKFFDNVNIFCSSSKEESFGIVILEAMKFNKPIIATKNNGSKSIIQHKKNGILINREPEEEISQKIANSILLLAKNQELSKSIALNGQNDLINKFSYKSLELQLIKIINSLWDVEIYTKISNSEK